MKTRIAVRSVITVFISIILANSAAYAQEAVPAQVNQVLSESLSISDSVAVSLSKVNRTISDSLSVGDSTAPSKATALKRQADDRLGVRDVTTKRLHAFRFAFEELSIRDPMSAKGPSVISISDPIKVSDSIDLSGALTPRGEPIITMQSARTITFSPDGDGIGDAATIEFDSTARGTYILEIRDSRDDAVVSIEGAMVSGRNSVTWDGNGSSGDAAFAGTYVYYVSARSEGGVRDPPSNGDGTLVIAGPASSPPDMQINYAAIIAAVAVAAGGAGFMIFWRRRKELILYLPVAASEVIGEIKQKYPGATVEDFVEQEPDGSKLYKGVKIENPEEDDESWLNEVINKAKELAGVDSVNVSYKGKVQAV